VYRRFPHSVCCAKGTDAIGDASTEFDAAELRPDDE
jgi:hypothetical protein